MCSIAHAACRLFEVNYVPSDTDIVRFGFVLSCLSVCSIHWQTIGRTEQSIVSKHMRLRFVVPLSVTLGRVWDVGGHTAERTKWKEAYSQPCNYVVFVVALDRFL